jgi:opacity protein-like surface antigen
MAQGDGSGLNAPFTVGEVHIRFEPALLDSSRIVTLRSSILNKLRIFPHENVRTTDIDLAMQRLRGMKEISKVDYRLELGTGNQYILIITVNPQDGGLLMTEKSGILTKYSKGSFPYLYRDRIFILKLDLGATVSPVAGYNTWLHNGQFFTQYSPFGKDYPPNNSFINTEYAFTAGLTAVVQISPNLFAYGNYRAIFMGTLGRDLYRKDNPNDIATENFYGGIVGTIPANRGHVVNFNVSAGRQPYRIGTGMLLCQIALNGGDRGALNVWPRFSGDFVGLAQVRYDNLRVEYFYVDPSEFGGFESNTLLNGFNVDYGKPYGVKAGFTFLKVNRSTSIYMFPDGSFESRNKLRAFNLRGEWVPKPSTNSLIAKIDLGLQNNARFSMLAMGGAAELGYLAGKHKLKPSVSYRFSHLTGDNPNTERFERWDFLYSGNDVDTWIQGLIMKNILFNTNLQAHRLQGQVLIKGFRLTGQYFYFRANQENNLPLAINKFASKELAHQLSLLAEKSFMKRFYTRLQIHSLWAKDGILEALPQPAKNPWVGMQAMIRYQL